MKPLHITDHALIRYIERVYGIDLDPIKAEIAGKLASSIKVGAASVKIDGITYCMVLNPGSVTLTTVIDGRQSVTAKRQKISRRTGT